MSGVKLTEVQRDLLTTAYTMDVAIYPSGARLIAARKLEDRGLLRVASVRADVGYAITDAGLAALAQSNQTQEQETGR